MLLEVRHLEPIEHSLRIAIAMALAYSISLWMDWKTGLTGAGLALGFAPSPTDGESLKRLLRLGGTVIAAFVLLFLSRSSIRTGDDAVVLGLYTFLLRVRYDGRHKTLVYLVSLCVPCARLLATSTASRLLRRTSAGRAEGTQDLHRDRLFHIVAVPLLRTSSRRAMFLSAIQGPG
jgi:hypothetical protein